MPALMRFGLLLLTLVPAIGIAQTPPESAPKAPDFDAELAADLGADAYGMRRYVMAFLKAGPNRSTDRAKAAELQKAHLANIRRLAEQGTLVLAGPFIDNGELRGIYIFAVDSVEQARELTATDPAIQAGTLEMELKPWYGSAAVMQVNELHARIAREQP